jgi:O-antigen/teichoic acid export membrane protein
MLRESLEAESHLHSVLIIPEGPCRRLSLRRSLQNVETVRPANGKSILTLATPDLDRSLLGGIAWTSSVTWLSQILSWGSTLIVVHYLAPTDYGLIGMALLYLGLVQMASELGVGGAVVRFRDLTTDQIGQFNGLSVIAGALGLLASLAVAVPFGHFFREPRLPVVLVVMSSAFLINAFRVVPQALLQRRLQFRKLALIEGTQSIVGACSTLTLAVLGFGYWALAFGFVISATVYAILVVVQNPTGFRRPRLVSIRHPLTFSSHVLLSRFAWYGYSNSDFAVIGKVLGGAALGAYTLGWTLSGMTVEKITAVVGRVTPAFFCTVQDDLPALRRYLLLITEGLALVTFPACIGLALVASDFVRSALGERWTAAILPVQLLAVVATCRSVQPLIPQVLFAIGHSRLNMRNAMLTALVLPVCFVVASRWGISGVAGAWLIVGPLMFSPLLLRTLRLIELPPKKYFMSLWPALSGCLVMAGAVISANRAFLGGVPAYASLIIKIAIGALAYAVALLVFHRNRITILRGMLHKLREQRPTAVVPPNPERATDHGLAEPVGAV